MQKCKKSNVFLVLSSETIGLVALSHVGQTDETQTALQASLLSEESPVASCDNPLNIPPLRPLPGATKPIPFVLAGDEAFPLSKHMLKPYPRRNLMVEERIANYRISRGRRISENILGILGNRWHCFRASFLLQPRKVQQITMAVLRLHNWLRGDRTSRGIYCPPTLIEREDPNTLRSLFPGLGEMIFLPSRCCHCSQLWFTTTTVKPKKCVRSSHSGLVMREMLNGSEECVDCKLNFNTTSSK